MSGSAVSETCSVFTALVGRPNVGKSSLLNRLVGEKAAIVSEKPQTTRTRITGILTQGPVQYVFLDTPGLHVPKTKIGSRMMKAAKEGAEDGDVVLMLFEPAGALRPVELAMAEALKNSKAIAGINKADTVREGEKLAVRAEEIKALGAFESVHVLSAKTGEGCAELLVALAGHAAAGPHFFAPDTYTDQPERVLAAEIIREKLLQFLQEEIPHGTAVEVERFHERADAPIVDVDAVIYCERKSHKGMVIGKGGAMLKRVASAARQDIEALLGVKINLQCWVKVRENWRDNDKALGSMGFGKQ